MIYFDNAASSMLHPSIDDEFLRGLYRYFANPSATHRLGMDVDKALRQCKRSLADHLNCRAEELITLSGATEANNLAILGFASNFKGAHIISSAYEHASVRLPLTRLQNAGHEVTFLREFHHEAILSALRENTMMVSIMSVNNEVGKILQLEDRTLKLLRRRGIVIHRDMVQSLGKFPIDLASVDLASFSAHKLGAFKGVGILYRRKDIPLHPLFLGGPQELSLRPGTQNVQGILSLGRVIEDLSDKMSDHLNHVRSLRDYIRSSLPEGWLCLSEADDSPYILTISLPSYPAEVLSNMLSAKHIYVSSGSACSSRSQTMNMTVEELFQNEAITMGSLRLSFSPWNSFEEAEAFIQALRTITQEIKGILS